MKIAIFGTGVVGQVIAEKLVSLNHDVMIGTRDIQTTLAKTEKGMMGRPPFGDWHKQNSKVKLGSFADAALFGEMIVNATNGFGAVPAFEMAGAKTHAGKTVLDISNPLDFSKGMPPTLSVSNTDSLGETLQRTFPETKFVKSLNTMTAFVMVNPAMLKESHTVFVAGNDDTAKAKVKELLQSFGWKAEDIFDLGDITTSRGMEMFLPLWLRIMMAAGNGAFNIKVVK